MPADPAPSLRHRLTSAVPWVLAAVVFPAVGVAWVHPTVPADPLAKRAVPAIEPQAADAVDPPGPPSAAAIRRGIEALAVRRVDPGRTSAGLNLRTVVGSTSASLVDLDGRVLHTWSADREAFGRGFGPNHGMWEHARLLDDGALAVIVAGVGVVAVERDGTHRWTGARGAHDALETLPDGGVRTVVRQVRRVPEVRRTQVYPIDQVVDLDGSGKVVRRLDLLELYREAGVSYQPKGSEARDLFGVNAFATAPDGHLWLAIGARRAFAELDGDALLREVDGPWAGVGAFELLPDGGWLMFDAAPDARSAPRVVERSPGPGPERWSFSGPELRPLSGVGGTVQRLPNGNTLITAGGAVEVAPDGAVVWEMSSPSVPPLALMEVVRLPPDCCTWLEDGP